MTGKPATPTAANAQSTIPQSDFYPSEKFGTSRKLKTAIKNARHLD